MITQKQKHEIQKPFGMKYMLLGRYKQDIEYYFGHGNRNERNLYFGEINEHFNEMVKLWKQLPYKPEWLTATQLIKYKQMI